jgi:hypothetical protein
VNKYRTGDLIQLSVARHYEQTLGASSVSVGNTPKYDIIFKDGTTMEVKVDALALQYFNAVIEFWDLKRDKPSGILETQAKLWIHSVPEGNGLHCYEMDTQRLRRLCIETGEVKTGGDNDSSVMKAIPLQKIKEISNSDFHLEDDIIHFVKYWD